jgi:tight adherence protein B
VTLTLLLIFLTVTLAVVCCFQIAAGFMSADSRRVQQRLVQEFARDDQENSAPTSPLFKNLDQLKIEPAPSELDFDRPDTPPLPLAPADLRSRLVLLCAQANVNLSVRSLVAVTVVLGLGLGLAGVWLRGLLLGLPAAALGAAVPVLFLCHRRAARREKFLKQLPSAFDLMARVLRAGHSVSQALQAVAESFDQPIAGEFANCQHQLNLGLAPEISFQEMAQRSGVMEMRIFVMAMLIQRQTGGNLSEVLERLASLIRARLRLRSQVRTLTAEGRMQGLTLAILPFLMFGAILIVNRSYAEVLFDHRALLLGTAAVMGLGVLWIRRIVSVDY